MRHNTSRLQHARKRRNESGAVLVVGLMLIFFFLFTAALVLDIARIERSALTLQQAADAASLAGAAVLKPLPDGTVEPPETRGWRAAKVAAFRLLGLNSVFGDSNEISGGPAAATNCSYLPAPTYLFDIDDTWRCVEFDYPNLVARIERGIYYKDGATQLLFASMEEATECCAASPCQDHVTYCSSATTPVLSPEVSNAVRVSLTLKRIPTIFAGLLHIGEVRLIRREAVASLEPYP